MKQLIIIALALTSVVAPAWSQSGVVDACKSTAAVSPGPGSLYICPQNDGQTFSDVGLTVVVAVRDFSNNPIVAIPAADFWIIGCSDLISLCHSSASSNADAITDINGQTTFFNSTIWGGGSDDQIVVIVQGVIIETFACTGTPLCLPVAVRSPDLTGDLAVTLADLTSFSFGFQSPPKPYEPPYDFNNDGVVSLADLVIFGWHMGHRCI